MVVQGDRFCDVDFRQLVKEPCKVVKDIYAHFGYDFSPEFEQRIEAYMSKCDPSALLVPSFSQFGALLDERVLTSMAAFCLRAATRGTSTASRSIRWRSSDWMKKSCANDSLGPPPLTHTQGLPSSLAFSFVSND